MNQCQAINDTNSVRRVALFRQAMVDKDRTARIDSSHANRRRRQTPNVGFLSSEIARGPIAQISRMVTPASSERTTEYRASNAFRV